MSDVDAVVGSATRGDGFGKGGIKVTGGIELERLRRIGDSDDPFPKLQEPEDEPPPDEPSPADHDAGSPGDRVVHRNHLRHVIFLRSHAERREEEVARGKWRGNYKVRTEWRFRKVTNT